jgi:hypothetical protein
MIFGSTSKSVKLELDRGRQRSQRMKNKAEWLLGPGDAAADAHQDTSFAMNTHHIFSLHTHVDMCRVFMALGVMVPAGCHNRIDEPPPCDCRANDNSA